MDKYDALRNHLAIRFSREPSTKMSLSFREIEKVMGTRLPASAYRKRAWWSNGRSRRQSRSWLDTGWTVDKVDLEKRTVTFQHELRLLISEGQNDQEGKLTLHGSVDEKGFMLAVAGPRAAGATFFPWRQVVQILIDMKPQMFGPLTNQPMHYIFPEMLADMGYSVVNWETGRRWG